MKVVETLNSRTSLWAILVVGILFVGFFLYQQGYFRADKELLPASIGRVLDVSSDHILVKFKPDVTNEKRVDIMSRHGLKEKSEIKQLGIKLVSVSGQNPKQVVNALEMSDGASIEFAEPDYVVEPGLVPNDPWFANWQKDKQQINSPGAWDVTTGSGSLILAIVDTGVNCGHEDLTGQCVSGWNFYNNNSDSSDVHGHGTAVAGVAAGVGNNNMGIAGNVWQSKIMPLRVSASDGTATYSAIASAIAYAADNGARVVNNSYQTGGSSTVRSAAGYLKGKGGLLVVSEGNYGSNTGYSNSSDIISVSAVDASDLVYSWSSFGADVDVSAPGCTGATTQNSGGYGSFCGTSNSAPEISGVLMLIWSINSSLTPDQAQDILFHSSVDLGDPGWDQYYGWGRVEAKQAVEMAIQGGVTPSPSISPFPSSTPSPSSTLPPGKARNSPKRK